MQIASVGDAMSGFGGFDPSHGAKSGFDGLPPVGLPTPVAPPAVEQFPGTPWNVCCGIPRANDMPGVVKPALASWPLPLGSLVELKSLSSADGWPASLAGQTPIAAAESWQAMVRSAIVRWRLLESGWNAVLNEVIRTPNVVMVELWRQSADGQSFEYLEDLAGPHFNGGKFGRVAAILEATGEGVGATLFSPTTSQSLIAPIGPNWILAVGRLIRRRQLVLACPVSLSDASHGALPNPNTPPNPLPIWLGQDLSGDQATALDSWVANLCFEALSQGAQPKKYISGWYGTKFDPILSTRLWNCSYVVAVMTLSAKAEMVYDDSQSVVYNILTWQRRCATQPLPPGFPWPNYVPIRLDTAVATAIGPKDSDVKGVQASLAKALHNALTSSSDAASQTALRGLFTGALAELRTLIAVGVATGWLPADEFLELVPILMDVSVAENVRLHDNGKGKFGEDHVFALAPSPFAWANAVLQGPPMTWFT